MFKLEYVSIKLCVIDDLKIIFRVIKMPTLMSFNIIYLQYNVQAK